MLIKEGDSMKVAVTGGTGFLGKYVCDALRNSGFTPIILTRNRGNRSADFEFRETNYTKNNLVNQLRDVEAVVHLAAKRGSQGLIAEFHDSEIITQNLYEACLENGIQNIVYASSISVYSNVNTLPWSETELPLPNLMYGISKLTCEHIGNIYTRNKGLSVKNLRFAHLYGFNEKNNYMINLFMRQAFNKKTLILNTQSFAKREFLYAKDAAKAVVCALNKKEISGTFNIGSGEALTNYEVAAHINNVFENHGNILIKNPEAKENIQPSYMDSSKALEMLGFTPSYSFSEALDEIYQLMKGLEHVPIRY